MMTDEAELIAAEEEELTLSLLVDMLGTERLMTFGSLGC